MTTTRDVVAKAIEDYDRADVFWLYEDCADEVLAALREHWTSDASISRLVGEPYMDWDQTAAIVAALFEESS